MDPSLVQASHPSARPLKISTSGTTKAERQGTQFHGLSPSPDLVTFIALQFIVSLFPPPPTIILMLTQVLWETPLGGTAWVIHDRLEWLLSNESLDEIPGWEYQFPL